MVVIKKLMSYLVRETRADFGDVVDTDKRRPDWKSIALEESLLEWLM
jgi:hypothetical protein